jgi:hypothetical protein
MLRFALAARTLIQGKDGLAVHRSVVDRSVGTPLRGRLDETRLLSPSGLNVRGTWKIARTARAVAGIVRTALARLASDVYRC